MQNIASQCFVSRHEMAVASFNLGGSRPRFEGRPVKGSRLPRTKQSQGEITETSPSGPARPRSEADKDVSTFSRSILTPSQTHRISIEERPSGHLSLSNGSGIYREAGYEVVECHLRALPTPSANDGPRFHTNVPVSELIEHDTRAIEASVVNSAPLVAKTEDGVTRKTRPTPIRP